MVLGFTNLVIGAAILVAAFWQKASDASPGLLTGLLVAGVGALSIGAYQIWRERYVYR